MADPPPPSAPYDFYCERYTGERTPEYCPFEYAGDFNNSIRMAFIRNLAVNVSEGTKDRLPQNMERARLLNEREAPSSREGPAECHSFDQVVLAHDVFGDVDERPAE